MAEIVKVTHDVKTFRLVDRNGGEMPFSYLPGQFLTLDIEPNGVPTRRSYSIASTPTWRDRIEMTVKREAHGLVSRWLHDELKPGDSLKVLAPNGAFVFTGDDAQNILLIGGGVGITPLMSVARYLRHSVVGRSAYAPKLPQTQRLHFQTGTCEPSGAQSTPEGYGDDERFPGRALDRANETHRQVLS